MIGFLRWRWRGVFCDNVSSWDSIAGGGSNRGRVMITGRSLFRRNAVECGRLFNIIERSVFIVREIVVAVVVLGDIL